MSDVQVFIDPTLRTNNKNKMLKSGTSEMSVIKMKSFTFEIVSKTLEDVLV